MGAHLDSTVLIYDGRATNTHAAFKFSDADFRCLLSWPLYKNNEEEVPLNAIVSVGYTISKYALRTGKSNLSSNVLFVIVLSVPKGPKYG